MLAVKGYYNGSRFVFDEDINPQKGQEVIVTIMDTYRQENINNTNKPCKDLSVYMGRGEKMFDSDAGKFIEELRNNDRI
jgi:hypothetical protein